METNYIPLVKEKKKHTLIVSLISFLVGCFVGALFMYMASGQNLLNTLITSTQPIQKEEYVNLPTPAVPALSTNLSTFETSLNAQQYTDLHPLLNSTVDIIIVGSEGASGVTPERAVEEITRFAKEPTQFDFNQETPEVKQLKTISEYSGELASYTIGISQNNLVLGYHVGESGKIDKLFFASNVQFLIGEN